LIQGYRSPEDVVRNFLEFFTKISLQEYFPNLVLLWKGSHTLLHVKSNPVILRVLAYLLGVILLACLLAPPLYWAGTALADRGVLPFLNGFPFHRYFSRCIQISALLMLWPAFRWIGIRRIGELGIDRNPLWRRDLLTRRRRSDSGNGGSGGDP